MDEPLIRYCRTTDGINIAYWTLGNGPPAIEINPLQACHLRLEWQVPRMRRMYELFARDVRLIRYDPRLCGLSDVTDDLSFEAFSVDIDAVVEASGGRAVALIAPQAAAALGVAYAAAHPGKVTSLVLLGPEVDYRRRLEVHRALRRSTPDRASESYRRILNPDLGEDAAPAAALNADLVRRGLEERVMTALEQWSATELLAQVECPTLVVDYPEHAFSDGPNAARRIKAARLVTRGGAGSPPFNADLEGLAQLVTDFILEHGAQAAPTAIDRSHEIPLSPRELEVLGHIAGGSTNAQIAEALVIAPGTAARHVSNMLAKTGLKNRTELANYAADHGLRDGDR